MYPNTAIRISFTGVGSFCFLDFRYYFHESFHWKLLVTSTVRWSNYGTLPRLSIFETYGLVSNQSARWPRRANAMNPFVVTLSASFLLAWKALQTFRYLSYTAGKVSELEHRSLASKCSLKTNRRRWQGIHSSRRACNPWNFRFCKSYIRT